jgi:hypothetical protein
LFTLVDELEFFKVEEVRKPPCQRPKSRLKCCAGVQFEMNRETAESRKAAQIPGQRAWKGIVILIEVADLNLCIELREVPKAGYDVLWLTKIMISFGCCDLGLPSYSPAEKNART